MAGWANSSAGAGGGGCRFPAAAAGGGHNSHSHRWRARGQGRGRPPPQPQNRYRPVNAHPSPSPPPHHRSMDHHHQGLDQAASTLNRPCLPLADDKPAAEAAADAIQGGASRNAANFECNVCFDMAADPVVTTCGHLFCWDCLYQWLHVHSHHRECPVCKGHVAADAIIPIYGRGGSAASLHTAPPRPAGARVDSCRHHLPDAAAALDLDMDLQFFLEEDDDEDEDHEDPFDLHEFRFASHSPWMPGLQLLDNYNYGDLYDHDDDYDTSGFDDVMALPMFAPSSSLGQAGAYGIGGSIMEALLASDMGNYHQPHRRHPNRRQPRPKPAAAHHSSADNDAGPNVARGGNSSGPHAGWALRRGRGRGSGRGNRNSTASGRGGMHQNNRR